MNKRYLNKVTYLIALVILSFVIRPTIINAGCTTNFPKSKKIDFCYSTPSLKGVNKSQFFSKSPLGDSGVKKGNLTYTPNAQSLEYLVKAGYIEKFTHFVEWPKIEIRNDSVFKIAVIGESKYGNNLDEIFRAVKVDNKAVEINYINLVDDIKNSEVLVIVGSIQNQLLDQILNYTIGKPILTISESSGYGKRGVLINMVLVNNYIRFEINKNSLSKSGLKINSLLLNSAIIIDAND